MQNKYTSQKLRRPMKDSESIRFQPSNSQLDMEDLSAHYSKHEAECEVCDYIEEFRDLDKEKFKEMFVFSEIISKPLSMRKRNRN